jgi:hypothetical protein
VTITAVGCDRSRHRTEALSNVRGSGWLDFDVPDIDTTTTTYQVDGGISAMDDWESPAH